MAQIGTLTISGNYASNTLNVTNNTNINLYAYYSYQSGVRTDTINSGSTKSMSANYYNPIIITPFFYSNKNPVIGCPAIIYWPFYGNADYDIGLFYYDGKQYNNETEVTTGAFTFEIPFFDAISAAVTNVVLSTNQAGSTIITTIDDVQYTITNTPTTSPITNGIINIDVSSHMPKDLYSVNINNGDNMLKIVDGDTQYNSFPATITVNANKAITAYGEPSPTITVNYENTTEPVVTNS